jgi:hypothetical protein
MARPKYPSDKQDQFMVRLPQGMRDRIANAAERNGRSMNAEIVQALEQMFPPEPSMLEIFERVHNAIEQAQKAGALPYKNVLIDALDHLSERLASGIEFDQWPTSKTIPRNAEHLADTVSRFKRWERARGHDVELEDLKREIERGLFKGMGRDTIGQALMCLRSGDPDRALSTLRLSNVKFAEKEASLKLIEDHLKFYYAENWGDPETAGEEDPF